MYTPSPKTAQLPKVAANRKWKTLFLPYVSKKSNYVIRLFSNHKPCPQRLILTCT